MNNQVVLAQAGISKEKVKKLIYLLAFVAYAVLTFFGALNHEIWFDEAQAWNIARENDIPGIFSAMKSEGHPALWHLILYFFIHLGADANILPFISWFFSVITVGIILWKSPLHPVMTLAMIFSMGFLYANSVVSRCYCILALFLCIFACIYPKRSEHPILYGTVIALLANTHICIWGAIGALGIYMLIELFIGFKERSAKQNIMQIIGLAIAGIGVLLLILPLIGSVTSNSGVERRMEEPISYVINQFKYYTYDVVEKYISYSYEKGSNFIICYLLGIGVWLFLILLRHNKKAFIVFLSFMFGFFVACEVLWITVVNRSAIFVQIMFIVLWIIKNNNSVKPVNKQIDLKFDSKIIKAMTEFIIKCDRKWYKVCCIFLTVLMSASIPVAFRYLISDYTSSFSPQKDVADYIEENLSSDSLFVSILDSDGVAVSSYLPEHEFYSLKLASFYKYKSHNDPDDLYDYDYDAIAETLTNYDNVYFISFRIKENLKLIPDSELLYYNDGAMPFCNPDGLCFYITKFSLAKFMVEKTQYKMEQSLQ